MRHKYSVAQQSFNLKPYLLAESVLQSEQHFSDLVARQVAPLVMCIIKHRLHSHVGNHFGLQNPEIDDIHGMVLIKIIEHLRELKKGRYGPTPEDFRGYVSMVAINACNEYFRQKYPEHNRLRFNLRYLLTHHAEFALWKNAEKVWLCGFRRWCGTDRPRRCVVGDELVEKISRSGVACDRHGAGPAGTVAFIFNAAEHPLSFDLLVRVVAELWQVKDCAVRSYDADPVLSDTLADTGVSPLAAIEQRVSLKCLWEELCQLPLGQRTALLLNLRDGQGRNVLTLLPVTRIATIKQISQVLEIPLDEFARMWNKLPLDDKAIAARLGATRQQVIKLRRAGRERLHRRLEQKSRCARKKSAGA